MFDLGVLGLDLLKFYGHFMISLLINTKEDLTEGSTAKFGLKFIFSVHHTRMRWVWLSCISCTHYKGFNYYIINWKELITTNDNYKNLLQVQLQQNFRVTPIYKEINDWDEDEGYHMGVYLSVHYKSHEFKHTDNNVYKPKK